MKSVLILSFIFIVSLSAQNTVVQDVATSLTAAGSEIEKSSTELSKSVLESTTSLASIERELDGFSTKIFKHTRNGILLPKAEEKYVLVDENLISPESIVTLEESFKLIAERIPAISQELKKVAGQYKSDEQIIATLRARLAALNLVIQEATTELSAYVAAEITPFATQVQEIDSELAEKKVLHTEKSAAAQLLKSQIAADEAKIKTLNDKKIALDAKIATLQESINAIGAKIVSLETRAADLVTLLADKIALKKANDEKISALQRELLALAEIREDNLAQIMEASVKIRDLMTENKVIQTEIFALKKEQLAIPQQMTLLKAELGVNLTNQQLLQVSLADIVAEAATLEASLASTRTEIVALETDVAALAVSIKALEEQRGAIAVNFDRAKKIAGLKQNAIKIAEAANQRTEALIPAAEEEIKTGREKITSANQSLQKTVAIKNEIALELKRRKAQVECIEIANANHIVINCNSEKHLVILYLAKPKSVTTKASVNGLYYGKLKSPDGNFKTQGKSVNFSVSNNCETTYIVIRGDAVESVIVNAANASVHHVSAQALEVSFE